jgi:hypothetical protein
MTDSIDSTIFVNKYSNQSTYKGDGGMIVSGSTNCICIRAPMCVYVSVEIEIASNLGFAYANLGSGNESVLCRIAKKSLVTT